MGTRSEKVLGMFYIAHRGLIKGPSKILENHPSTIDKAIEVCGNAECDIWMLDNGTLWLGHDTPTYEITQKWLWDHDPFQLWIHCKNIKALEYFNQVGKFHYFWHQEDTVTLTSRGFIWAYPGKQPIINSIAVLPEIHNDDISECIGICTDYVLKYQG